MKKKILLAVLMVSMLVCAFAMSISAAEPCYNDGEWIYADDDTTKLAIRDTEGNPLIWYMNGEELKWVRADQTDETQSVYVKYSISAGGSGFDNKVFVPQKALKGITIVDNGTEIAGSGSNLSAQKIVLLNLERLDIDALNGWLFGNKNGCCPLLRGLVLPSTLKGIGQEGFTNHKVVQIWNLENTQLMYISTANSAPFSSTSLTQEATDYTFKFPSTLTVLPVVQRSCVKTVIFSPNTSSQNTNRTLGDMPNIEKMFIPAAMAEVGFNPETFRSTTNMLLFFTGTMDQAIQMQSNSDDYYQGHFKNEAQLVSFADYLKDPATYDNAKGICIIYDTNECYAFYDNEHEESNNPCVVNCDRCQTYGLAKENPVHSVKTTLSYVSFDKAGAYITACTNEGCKHSESVEAPALFVCLGYSASENGSAGFILAYKVNHEAIENYKTETGNALEYGMFAVLKKNIGENGILNADGSENAGVIKADLTKNQFDVVSIKVKGFTTDEQKDAQIALGLYVIADGESKEISYCQSGTPNEGEQFTSTSYNQQVSTAQ